MKKIFILVMMVVAVAVANAQYRVGDIYNENGVKGIVVIVTDGGEHGMLMSLECVSKKWTKKDLKFETRAFHEDDGMKNMAEIEKYINESGKSWKDFELFEWARELGEGWYIPSSDELIEVLKSINGGVLEYNQKNFENFDKKLKKAKGKTMRDTGFGGTGNLGFIYSSTEASAGNVLTSYIQESVGGAFKNAAGGAQKGTIVTIPYLKNMPIGTRSRAVYKF